MRIEIVIKLLYNIYWIILERCSFMQTTVIKLIAKVLEADESTIGGNTLILEELGATSLDVIEIITDIEDSLNISIPDEEIPGFKSVGDIVNYIENRLAQGEII